MEAGLTPRPSTAARLLILAALALLALVACAPQAPLATDTFQVLRVIDGDTIIVEGGIRVRYIGVDAPEMSEPLGQAAKEANQALVRGKRVRLEKDVSDTDRYDRWLRYVYVDRLMVNAELVRLGMARTRAYPPDTKYQGYLERMEKEARDAGSGIWAR